MTTTTPPTTVRKRVFSIMGGSLGNLVEWFDWFAYASFAIYFAPVFFPAGDPTAQLLSTAAIFAVGFVVSFLSALVVIRAFIGFVAKRDFTPFAWYRIAAGSALLVWWKATQG